MLKKESTYLTLLLLMIAGYVIVEIVQPDPVDWSESYSRTDRIPYGASLTYDLLEQGELTGPLQVNNAPLFNFPEDSLRRNWIFMNSTFGLDQWETELLMQKVAAGDHVFIAAKRIENSLADSLGVLTGSANPLLGGDVLFTDNEGEIRFLNEEMRLDTVWEYKRNSIRTYFSTMDPSNTAIIGVTNQDDINFISVSHGKGRFYLHANPAVFSNYYLRDYHNAGYLTEAMKLLPDRPTIWDEYYKPGRLRPGNVMVYIVSQRNLKIAWWLGLTGVLLFMFFRAKRKQRIIPEIKAPENSSVEFAESVGSLYLEKGDHQTIADKRISFLYDHLRNNVRIDIQKEPIEQTELIAGRTGTDRSQVQKLLQLCEDIRCAEGVSESDLKALNEEIDAFYRKAEQSMNTIGTPHST